MAAKAKAKARPAKPGTAPRPQPGPKSLSGDDPKPHADMAALVTMITALAPILQSMMSLANASAEHCRRAVAESARADAASLTALAGAVDTLLSPHPPVPRNPAVM